MSILSRALNLNTGFWGEELSNFITGPRTSKLKFRICPQENGTR